MQSLFQRSPRLSFLSTAVVALAACAATALPAHAGGKTTSFHMVRSPALDAVPACVADARATVKIEAKGIAETMTVDVDGLPPYTEFDFFVLQVPNFPFGMAWYQGDIETDAYGHGTAKFIGRFNIETFMVAPGVAPAPQTQPTAAASNPATPPIQMYHLGLWFNSPTDAVAAGCPATVTPFNGDHSAGIQVLNTSNFVDLKGPLLRIKS
jgi:hypothetical protein